MKALVILILLAILASLGSGLYYLTRDSRDSQRSSRLLKALQIRVALSAFLVLFLVLSYTMGWLGTYSQ